MSSDTIALLTIAAIIIGPAAAVQIQKWLEEERETRKSKLWIFKTLMMYRATPVNPNFVQALNLIDVEFTMKAEKEVRTAWKILLDHLGEDLTKAGALDHTVELTADLLVAMGKCLGYDFDKVYVKKGAYYPMGLGNMEAELHALRRKLLDVLEGQRRVPVAIFEEKFPDIVNPEEK